MLPFVCFYHNPFYLGILCSLYLSENVELIFFRPNEKAVLLTFQLGFGTDQGSTL
jgi:hypothetical protein